jgi:hypothetical protein
MNCFFYRINSTSKFFIFAFAIVSIAWGRVELTTKDSTVNLGISVAGWLQNGQIVEGYGDNGTGILYHQWQQQTFFDLGFDATISERIRVAAGIEDEMFFSTPKGGSNGQLNFPWFSNNNLIIDNAYGSYAWGDTGSPFLSLTFGKFRYKYNPESRNLGEYLFRSGTYPAYLINNFDQPFARLTGLKISSSLFGMLHQDLLLTLETDIPPFYDASLSYLAGCDIGKFLDVGAGVEFAHLFSVDESQTSPKDVKTKYVVGNSTNYYTFQGIKLMARASFDPKPFIPQGFFGKEDLKIYSEAAILGLENYPANDSGDRFASQKNAYGYDTLANKIAVLIGFNVPTFKLLDVLSLETEWYGCPYPNNYQTVDGIGTAKTYPLPDPQTRPLNSDKWKWSVYAKKMILHDHFGVVFQCARDNMRLQSASQQSMVSEMETALDQNNKMWWWMTKLVAQF